MATSETQLSKKCVQAKPEDYFAERIENSSGNGTADLVLSRDSIDTWIELKCCARPKNADTPINCKHIRKGQIQWHRRKRKAGCTTWILIQVGSGKELCYYAFHSLHAPSLKEGMAETFYVGFAYRYGTDLERVLDDLLIYNIDEAKRNAK